MTPRLVMIDDNIQDASGHYLELAQLLGDAASKRGMNPILATNKSFAATQTSDSLDVRPLFCTNGMVRWSLGANGLSHCQRDLSGKPINAVTTSLLSERFREFLRPANRRPRWMLRHWKTAFIQFIDYLGITESDQIIVNTSDEFTLLAIASALRLRNDKRLNLHLIFHFSVNDKATRAGRNRNLNMGKQIKDSLKHLEHHHVRIHATTRELKADLDSVTQRDLVNSIPYPTRPSLLAEGFQQTPCKATLAGMPRTEKGKHLIGKFLANLEEHELINSNRFRPSLQVSERQALSMLPPSLKSQGGIERIELITRHLPTDQYHQWLNETGIGIFLYDPTRYRTRCSGVLLEMMCRGIPVIVPDNCWLSSQLNLAGGHESVGYIYQEQDKIPLFLRHFLEEKESMTERARAYAMKLRAIHSAEMTLTSMGI